jgi:acetyl esterase/lipase
VHDSWEALLWLQSTGRSVLNLDLSKAAIGGSSAGGNLTATMCHKALTAPSLVPKFKAQLLIVPVTDNTADPSNNWSYKENEFVPALPSAKMIWYRKHYLPNPETWADPEASPLLYKDGWAAQPKALVVIGALDVLRAEGEQYVEKLKEAGVPVDVKIMDGMPHPFLAMDGALQQGKDAISYMVETLQEAFR